MREDVIGYARKPARVSKLAVAALVISGIGAVMFFLVVPSLLGFVMGIVAGRRIDRNAGKLAGVGYANAAVVTSLCSVFLLVMVALLLPSRSHSGPGTRSYCAANLRGIVQSMIVYSAENNDAFPVVTYAPYSAALNSPRAAAVAGTADDVMKRYYVSGKGGVAPQAGSVTACLWMLVLRNSTSPKQFICRDDPTPTEAGKLEASPGKLYDNFQSGQQISYSAAYPWKADGTVGKWWTNTTDSSLPLLADMAPLDGTGTPRRDLTARTVSDPKMRNSANHAGQGQNVAFADAHTEFVRRPDIGQDDDNIWTSSGVPSKGAAATGGVAAGKYSPSLMADKPAFDVVMYPVRDVGTGGM